ncbi:MULTISPECIES: YajG family lipoprotein [Rodentibacter]|uniref:YajG family lipoprotein n=1 Tax=Rodentibacter TaxID=1960084 RepID=UPI001CFC6F13|nr:YajG family lipoprotein [Rodentibacter sp. JRC1]GJI55433.1 putative lipoprotein [Rodentibacter sp. JRC1]
MKLTNKIKAFSAVIAAILFLIGCQAPSNTLTFTPQAPTASMNVNQTAVVYVMANDVRAQPEVSFYVKNGELVKLNASPSVTQLFQQVMQQNLISKGFRIGQANNSNAGVTVQIKDFFTNVDQGNLRYHLTAKIQVDVLVQGSTGNYSKIFNATRSQSGAFNADNDEIQKVLGETFKDIVNNIYQDQEISQAINRYSR